MIYYLHIALALLTIIIGYIILLVSINCLKKINSSNISNLFLSGIALVFTGALVLVVIHFED